jgi:flagellar basal body P-ring protein FlgI
MSERPSVKQTELPQAIKNAYKKAEEGKKVERTDTVGISESTAMFSGIVRELRDAGVSSKDITKALQHSNRKT